ncbi:MAG TPA: T9SS type A sorting domain-containing protein [Ignavibacteria bacterium]|nr:T9SS type A sorting domain-containing protein [Ignavibacteria bacterium]HMQ98135.1 T9SS type A sorting domain-containing protein [Ignavibacteria bacterium]
MKKNYGNLIALIIIVIISAIEIKVNSQTIFNSTHNKGVFSGQYGCYNEGIESKLAEFRSGRTINPNSEFTGSLVHKTPEEGQFLRILILYVRFPDDDLVGDNMNGYAVWDDPTMDGPRNPHTKDGKFIDTEEGSSSVDFTRRYRQYTISDYFAEMSLGTFDVIGDEYFVTLQHPSTFYKESGMNFAQINEEAIKRADELYDIDFSRYNNWTFTPDGWTWLPGGGDSRADMIIMEYRRAPGYPEDDWFMGIGFPISGIADLGISSGFQLDATTIAGGSGVTCLSVMQNYSKMTQIMLHEMTHRYTGNHYDIGLMTGVEHSCFNYSPFERSQFEYVTPVEIPFPYAEQSAEFTLRDYVFTGDLLSIAINSTGEKYYIANHQKKSVYDGISRGGNICWNINRVQQDPYCDEGKGLFIYQHMAPAVCNNFKDISLVQADGKFDWYIERMVPYFLPEYSFEIPLYERIAGNPRGFSEFHQPLDLFLPNMQEVNDNPCSDKVEDYFVTYDWLGDGEDAFNMGYDEIFSPYSNPQTITCSGEATGLTVKLLSQDSITGDITIKVYYNDALALSELPPAKPKNLKVAKDIFEPLSGRFHPALSWDKNSEPDFRGTGNENAHYNIYRSIITTCQPDTGVVFDIIATVPRDSGSYTDTEISLYPEGTGSVVCTGLFRSVMYKIEAVDMTGLASVHSNRSVINGYSEPCDDSALTGITHNQLPVKYSIFNYPNPFNPTTKIKFSLPSAQYVNLKIYNITGQEIYSAVNNEFKPAGYYSVDFDGSNLPSGVYFYVIRTENYFESKKMVLLK